jgi:hypothetical protein
MNEPERGLATLGLDKAIRLRWALRDIRGKRLKLTPIDPNDLRTLIDMGYVEMKDDQPVVTNAGLEESYPPKTWPGLPRPFFLVDVGRPARSEAALLDWLDLEQAFGTHGGIISAI